jgi:hypothetical protein
MKKYTLLAGSHVVGDKVFNAGDVVASDDNLVALHKGKFAALPEPEVVYVEVTTTAAPEPVAEATEAVEEPEAPKKGKAK